MNREILFKAKRIDSYKGDWVQGYLVRYGFTGQEKYYIVPDYASDLYGIAIDPRTICQYTGLTDKNGNKIWENDIVNCFEAETFGQINWNESEAGFYFEQFLEGGGFDEENIYDYVDCMEVIGNIFDNPELLEGGEEE